LEYNLAVKTMQYKLLVSPWKNEFINAFADVKKELVISSPFIDMKGTKILSDAVSARKSVEISLVTNLTTQNIINGFTDPSALLELHNQFAKVQISSLGRLHAKVYLIDDKIVIITSANLTGGGLLNNFEYGVLLEEKNIIFAIKEDISKYYLLGNIFDRDTLEKINEETTKIGRIKNKAQKIIKGTKLAQLLRRSTDNLSFELLRNRIKEGKTINAIFSDTILYLLQKKGPLSTEEMHPLIQIIHSDICDDSIDRVIDGQHFGKKWKHLVRNAQQALKKNRLIELKDKKWHLT